MCDTDWHYFKSSCYNWHPRNHTFDEARNICRKQNGSLARVITNESYEFIKENILKTAESVKFWSALHRCHSSWYLWTDGTPLTYSSFRSGEPNNDNGNEHCIEVYSDATWNDQDCSKEREFICENRKLNN